jgi:predicted transcriptional regulator
MTWQEEERQRDRLKVVFIILEQQCNTKSMKILSSPISSR